MRRCALLLALILAACGGSTEPRKEAGPLKLGIVSGQGQVVTAGSSQLGAPVVGRLVRQANGQVAWQRLERVGGWIIRPAYAQGGTVVTGSPVPGAVVCAVSVDSVRHLTPWTPCTNTDSEGKATFFFTPGTKAGEALAEIRGTVEQSPAVFDTARAVITAGAVDTLTARTGWYLFTGESAPLSDFVARAADRYGNVIAAPTVTFTLAEGWTVADGRLTAPGTERLDDMALAVGARSATVRVGAMRDLGNVAAWDATGQCVLQPGAVSDGATYVDSLTYAMTVGRAAYQSAGVAGSPLKLGIAEFGYEGNRIRYWATGRVDTVTATGVLTPYQRGDSLYWALVSPGQSERVSARAGEAPVAYAGGNTLCGVGVGQVTSYRPMQMVAR